MFSIRYLLRIVNDNVLRALSAFICLFVHIKTSRFIKRRLSCVAPSKCIALINQQLHENAKHHLSINPNTNGKSTKIFD